MALNTSGKVLYSLIFLVVVPLALVGWSAATEGVVHMPPVTSLPLGVVLASLGASLMLWGMKDLWSYGGGLPMNAHPPPRLVVRGTYRLLPHPIYTGFSLLTIGVSIISGSASGLWLVSPMVMLCCASLVLGYEQHDLQARFGQGVKAVPTENEATTPSTIDRWRVMLLAILPWAVAFAIVHFFGRALEWRSVFLISSNGSRILDWANLIHLSAYPAFVLIPFIPKSGKDLRHAAISSLLTLGLAFAVFLAAPLILSPHLLRASAALGFWEGHSLPSVGGWDYFPSLPVIFALLATQVLRRRWRRSIWVAAPWALLVSICMMTSAQGGLVRVAGALLSFGMAANAVTLWRLIRWAGEHIANSWQEWRFGPVRVINHGSYVGAAGFLGILIGGVLAGPKHLTAIVVAALAALIGAALWAQYVEGSPQLLRPYGFYGGLLGGTLGALAAPIFHTSFWLLLGVFSAAGSLVQAVGRLRCLVQGCCHGRPAPEGIGIRYEHPNSRVCRLSPWTGVPLHATPVYSILWNLLVTLLLWRLWAEHASLHLIVGLYFMLSGLGRFVEESFRGEPQTKIVAGLRLYQWSAITSVVLGAAFTAFGTAELAPDPTWSWGILPVAIVFGLLVWFAMGVDFPESHHRFSRLT
jgi:prolipoprotein diacylglyceryltransferase/protein-S-isoprenylcysteine O-methyltransferase Ste14